MKKTIIFIISVILIIAYLISINLVFYAYINYDNNIVKIYFNTSTKSINPSVTSIEVIDSVSSLITRPRFYGTYYELSNNVRDKQVVLYLFNFIEIPIQKNKIKFIYFHVIFLVILICIIVLLSIFLKGGKRKDEEIIPSFDNTIN